MDQTAVKLESLERSGNADVQVIEASQIIENQNNGLVANQLATSGIQLVQANQATSGSLPWVLPPQYQMMLLSPGMSPNLFNNGNLLTLQDGHVLVTPVSDSGQLSDATVQALQQTQGSLIQQKAESEMVTQQQTMLESQPQPQPTNQKTEKPKLPKKPLNTYMMFSKAIWPQVKAANSHLSSVTEIGAIVGAIWRELDASQKQQYNEYFIKDKERYENELRAYRQMTGMSETDSIKPPKQKRCKESKSVTATSQATWQTSSSQQNNNQHANNGNNNSTSIISQEQLRQAAADSLTADQLLVQQVLAQAGLSAAGVSSTGQLILPNSDGSINIDNNFINLLALHSQSFSGVQTANNLSADKHVENLVSNVISADQANWLWQAKVEGHADSVLQQQSSTEAHKDGATIYYDEQQKQFILKSDFGSQSVVSAAGFVDHSALSSGSSREQLEAELQQLRSALSEKTSQVQALTSKLEEAKRTIEIYQQQVQQMAVVAVAAACSESNAAAATTVESTMPASSTK